MLLLALGGTLSFIAAPPMAAQARSGTAARPSSASPQQNGARDADAQRLADEAQAALSKGDYLAAIGALEKLAKIAPKVAEVHANLAAACYTAGRLSEAAAEAETALKLKPTLVNAHFFLGLSLAETDRCAEALPYLEKDYARVPEPKLKLQMESDGLHCGMATGQDGRAVDFARALNHDFPDDPDALYLTSHAYSDLATRASQRLLEKAPGSYQAHRVSAEVLELQGKLSDAADEYRKVLAINPNLPGIHYEIGRLLLAGTPSADNAEQARHEFEEELKIDPSSAAAEYQLGEMAWQARQWNDAIARFRHALEIDPEAESALVGLGKALVSAGRAPEAVAPLEKAAQIDPGDPGAHYQLSFAYRRVGRASDADREMAMYQQTHDQQQRAGQAIRSGMVGDMTAKPPQ
ncbi:MAG TPA: tetratricopeptide repeat protein [Terriglobia bacterium]|nr:tetratricopeptide repeat protein [Terriglobia bacterium]